ncbi:MAG: tetratricopeptide repeat protein [Gammaproteobacteria bacterium]|nr:tetratricopeptide repeat protein [Gammaproteobacteria bacterium]
MPEHGREKVAGWLLRGCLIAVAVSGCVTGAAEDGATLRGDQAWAHGDYEEALAEYRLAARRGANSGDAHLRVAHAYARLGRVDEARQAYRRAIDLEPDLADQAVSDLVRLARTAQQQADRFALASALEAAAELNPDVNFARLAFPLASHYAANGEHARALVFFQRALSGDSVPEVLYEAALAYEEVGACEAALAFYGQFTEAVPTRQQRDAGWHIGKCSYDLAQEYRDDGDHEGALTLIQETVARGEPRTHLARAYYEMGELLVSFARCDEAVDAFRGAAREDPSASRALARRAEHWIDQLRFGVSFGDEEGRGVMEGEESPGGGPPGWPEDLEWAC